MIKLIGELHVNEVESFENENILIETGLLIWKLIFSIFRYLFGAESDYKLLH